jgi:Short C-terminal domain
MMVAGGVAYAAGRRANQGDEQGYEEDEQGDEQGYDAPPPAPPAPAAAPADDATSELERLASLHDSGVLSDDEFAAAKAKVLGI